MLAAVFAAAAQAGAPQPVVQVAVADPVLPAGPLGTVGAVAEGDVYLDMGSVKRSDIPGLINSTAVIMRPGDATTPILVARIWINCNRNVYQISSGRLYSAQGQEVGATGFVPDQPIPPGGAAAQIAQVYCTPDWAKVSQIFPWVMDWRAALERSRRVASTPPGGAHP